MNIYQVQHNIKGKERQHGFSLVELMVAIGIMVILSISLLIQQSKFDSSVYITNVAYEIALTLRQAQTYSVSSVVGTNTDNSSYGVYFNKNNKEVIFYRNNDSTSRGYDEGDDAKIETYTIPGNTEIDEICADADCSHDNVSISFVRPNPDPTFIFDSPSGSVDVAKIIIINDEETRTISISQTGQIQNE